MWLFGVIVPKLSYLLRCVPPTCISAYAAEMDGQVLNCASKLLKLNDRDMKKSKIIQQLQFLSLMVLVLSLQWSYQVLPISPL